MFSKAFTASLRTSVCSMRGTSLWWCIWLSRASLSPSFSLKRENHSMSLTQMRWGRGGGIRTMKLTKGRSITCFWGHWSLSSRKKVWISDLLWRTYSQRSTGKRRPRNQASISKTFGSCCRCYLQGFTLSPRLGAKIISYKTSLRLSSKLMCCCSGWSLIL